MGVLLAITLCLAIDVPGHTVRDAWPRALLLVSGVGGAMLLALFLWPVRPWGPARVAASESLEALASLVRDIGRTHGHADGERAWLALAARAHPGVRTTLESAREAIAATRALRAGSSARGNDLLELQASVGRLFTLMLALEEELAGSRGAAREEVDAVLQAITAVLDCAADRVTRDRELRHQPDVAALDHAVLALWDAVEQARGGDGEPARGPVAHAHLSHAAALLEAAATEAQDALAAAELVREGRRTAERRIPGAIAEPASEEPESWWRPLRAALAPDSLMLRHALRLAVAATFTYGLARSIDYGYGLWATTTVIVVLQPWAGTTLRRGVERVAGTVAGAVVAALLSLVVRGPVAIALLMFPLSVLAVAYRRVHYGAFTFFLTPVFILMTERTTGDWSLAWARVGATLAGGAIALVASRVLWPSWEHQRLPGQIAGALESTRALLALVRGGSGADAATTLEPARRAAGLAVLNVEAALQRYLAEPRGGFSDVSALLELVAHQRRLHGAITALAHRPPLSSGDADRLLDAAQATLGDTALAIREGRRPPPAPIELRPHARTGEFHLDAAAPDHALAPVARVARHVTRLVEAAERAV